MLEDVVAKYFLKQTAVYWAPSTVDVWAKKTFSDPVEVDCLWNGKTLLKRTEKGDNIKVIAEVLVGEDLEFGGFMFLGDLDDLDSSEESDPILVEDAWEIVEWIKAPVFFAPGEFIRTATVGTRVI